VTVQEPSGDISLVGALGGSWNIIAFAGFRTCTFAGACNSNGGTCTNCTGVDAPVLCPPAAGTFCTDNRPSCTSALGGSDALAFAHVVCLR
jgi:hypothetical protein